MNNLLKFNVSGLIILVILLSSYTTINNVSGITTDLNSIKINSEFNNQAVSQWRADKDHSNITFTLIHLGIAEIRGFFTEFDCIMESTQDNFADSKIEFTIDVNSLDTNNPVRDQHLKSNDFFNAVEFPQITFSGKSFKYKGGKYKLTGDLTIRDVTKSVSFDVKHPGTVTAMGLEKAAFQAVTTLNRFDYKLNWIQTIENGELIVGKDVTIVINLEMDREI